MAISRYEQRFMDIVFEIMSNGYYQVNERTGIGTKRISNAIIGVDCATEVPLLKSKKTMWKSSVEEMLWIFRDGSNDIHDLRPKIWDSWADSNGIVQKTYGYQIRKYDQVRRILGDLKKDSSTRRAVIDLWNNADLPEMAITPCVYTSVWDVVGGRLNCMVVSRSCDLLVGGVFNIFQYFVMNNMFARHLGLKPGIMTFCIADCHIYENQQDGANKMLAQYGTLLTVGQLLDQYKNILATNVVDRDSFKRALDELEQKMKQLNRSQSSHNILATLEKTRGVLEDIEKNDLTIDPVRVYECEPSFTLGVPTGTSFFDMGIEDITVSSYKSMQKIDFPVAV